LKYTPRKSVTFESALSTVITFSLSLSSEFVVISPVAVNSPVVVSKVNTAVPPALS